jgi:uncharacterized protein YoxC
MTKKMFNEDANQPPPQKPHPKKASQATNASTQKMIEAQFHEAAKMLEKMNKMGLDINQKFAYLYELSKRCNVDLENYFQSIYKRSYKEIEERKRILKEEIAKAIPPEACTRKATKSTERLTQERRGKMRGARKKWIPIK